MLMPQHSLSTQTEQIKLAYGNIANTTWPPLIAIALLLWIFWGRPEQQAILGWGVITGLYGLCYAFNVHYQLKKGITTENSSRQSNILVLSSGLLGICWGSLAWIAITPEYVAGSLVVMAILTAVAASVMAALAPLLRAFIPFAIFEVVGVSIKLLMLDDPAYLALGIGMPAYLFSLLAMAKNTNQFALEAIKQRFTNAELISHLREKHEEAELANRAKTKFLASASHDLRQPIHAQGLYLDVLARSQLSPQDQHVLEQLHLAWQASAEMLNTLLDYSRIEAGVVKAHVQPFLLNTLFQKMEKELAPLAEAQELLYRTRETSLAIDSDPVLVELILRNLISNAIRYTEKGGLLVGCRRRQSKLVIEVWDTGIGVNTEQQKMIFQEFHQVNNSERDRRKGLGLGLAIAQSLTELLNSHLEVQSRPKRGSVFRFELPITNKPIIETTQVIPAKQVSLNLTVLVVDDDETVRDAMALVLEGWGCQCLLAESLSEAKQLCSDQKPQLIISDYRLRDGELGHRVIEALQQLLDAPVPAILITGDTAPRRIREANISGSLLLHKPLSSQLLYQHIQRLFPGNPTTTDRPSAQSGNH